MKILNWLKMSILFIAVLTFQISAADPHEMQMEEMRKEIRLLQGKTEEIKEKIKNTEEKAAKDSVSYEEYLQESSKRVEQLAEERDSLFGLVALLDEKRAEIENSSETLEMRKVNYRALGNSVLGSVIRSCKEMQEYLEKYKQFNIDRELSALQFLAGELSSGAVDAIEGIERYYQIVKQMEKHSEGTEVWRGKAPGGLLKGEVSYLRLGFVWLACINAENTKGLIWDTRESKWKILENSVQLLNIRKAVDLVSGSAAPQLVALPFSHDLVVKKAGEKSND